jgi:hypothetical protein
MYLPRSRTKIVIVNGFLFAFPIIKANEQLVRFMRGPVGVSFLKDVELREYDQKGGELSYPRSLINDHASCKPLETLRTYPFPNIRSKPCSFGTVEYAGRKRAALWNLSPDLSRDSLYDAQGFHVKLKDHRLF